MGAAKCGEGRRGNINTTAQQPTGFSPPVGEALAAPRGDLLEVPIAAEPPFLAVRAVFLTLSYCCLFVPWSAWKWWAPARVMFVFISV